MRTNNTPLNLAVGTGQLGAHMLFVWDPSANIDVVLAWDFYCSSAELVTSDPDGDGFLDTKIVDGPFKGLNAAFDVHTTPGNPLPRVATAPPSRR